MVVKKFFQLLLLCFLYIPSCTPPPPATQHAPISEDTINQLGQSLEKWANSHCTNIAIENIPILIEDGNAGGCSQVWWQHPEGVAFQERGDQMPESIRLGAEQWHNQNEAVKAHLTALLNTSNCNTEQLLQTAASFSTQTSPDEIATHLSCLGKTTFTSVEFGIE